MPIPAASSMALNMGNTPMVDADGCIQAIGYKVPVKTLGAAYTCTAADSGTHFCISGADVTFTLPAVATSTGFEYWFGALTDHIITVTAPAGTLATFNNTAATSMALDQSGMKIGAILHVFCTGTKWIGTAEFGNILQVLTVS
jgi:hypothetical protein